MDRLILAGLSLKLCDVKAQLVNHSGHPGLHVLGFGGLHYFCKLLLLSGQDSLHFIDLLGLFGVNLVDRRLKLPQEGVDGVSLLLGAGFGIVNTAQVLSYFV
jgi:hypothetical protein